MASQGHIKLAEEVKKVHFWLRSRTQEVGAQQAWKEHLERKEMLQNYARAMKTLAEEHWTKNNQGDRKTLCRLEWINQVVQEYFLGGGLEKAVAKESSRLKISDSVVNINFKDRKLKLLDVGSCYNPFKQFPNLETYAVDLCPASEDVKECNFLDVEVVNSETDFWDSERVTQLPRDFFDVVVFCLFLEYLPSPDQRLKACELAWSVLKPGGVLTVVTPDSNHQSANSSLMKSWKIALAQIGFIRFKIEKLKYLYCMAFRKTVHAEKYKTLPEYHCNETPQILIPQDTVDYESRNKTVSTPTFDYDRNFVDGFSVLPCAFD